MSGGLGRLFLVKKMMHLIWARRGKASPVLASDLSHNWSQLLEKILLVMKDKKQFQFGNVKQEAFHWSSRNRRISDRGEFGRSKNLFLLSDCSHLSGGTGRDEAAENTTLFSFYGDKRSVEFINAAVSFHFVDGGEERNWNCFLLLLLFLPTCDVRKL